MKPGTRFVWRGEVHTLRGHVLAKHDNQTVLARVYSKECRCTYPSCAIPGPGEDLLIGISAIEEVDVVTLLGELASGTATPAIGKDVR